MQLDGELHGVEGTTLIIETMFPVNDRSTGHVLGVDGERLEVFPVVSVEADRSRTLGAADIEQFGDADAAAENRNVEECHGMHHSVGKLLGGRAVGEQKILPMGDRVMPSGETVSANLRFIEHATSTLRHRVGSRVRDRILRHPFVTASVKE